MLLKLIKKLFGSNSNLQESQLTKVDSPVGRNKAATPAVSGNASGAGNAPLNALLIPAYSSSGRNDDHGRQVAMIIVWATAGVAWMERSLRSAIQVPPGRNNDKGQSGFQHCRP